MRSGRGGAIPHPVLRPRLCDVPSTGPSPDTFHLIMLQRPFSTTGSARVLQLKVVVWSRPNGNHVPSCRVGLVCSLKLASHPRLCHIRGAYKSLVDAQSALDMVADALTMKETFDSPDKLAQKRTVSSASLLTSTYGPMEALSSNGLPMLPLSPISRRLSVILMSRIAALPSA